MTADLPLPDCILVASNGEIDCKTVCPVEHLHRHPCKSDLEIDIVMVLEGTVSIRLKFYELAKRSDMADENEDS